MAYRFVRAAWDYPRPRGATVLGSVSHMAEGGGTVGYLDDKPPLPPRGNSSHFVIEYSGTVVQMVRLSRASGSVNPKLLRTDDDADGAYGISYAKAVLGDHYRDPNAVVVAIEFEGFAKDGPNAKQVGAWIELHAFLHAQCPDFRGNLGHRDFQDYKACPGHRIPWEAIGGHGLLQSNQGEIVSGFVIAIPNDAKVGVVAFAKGTEVFRLSTGESYKPPVDVPGRTATEASHAVSGGSDGYLVNLSGSWGAFEACFVRASDATFTPAGAPPPANCDAAVNAALDHVQPAAQAVLTAITEARPRP